MRVFPVLISLILATTLVEAISEHPGTPKKEGSYDPFRSYAFDKTMKEEHVTRIGESRNDTPKVLLSEDEEDDGQTHILEPATIFMICIFVAYLLIAVPSITYLIYDFFYDTVDIRLLADRVRREMKCSMPMHPKSEDELRSLDASSEQKKAQ